MWRGQRLLLTGLLAVAGLGVSFAAARLSSSSADESRPQAAASSVRSPARPSRGPGLFAGLNVSEATAVDGQMEAPLAGNRTARLTLRPDLQAHLASEFRRYHVPFGAAVVMEPRTGRVLAYVSHQEAGNADLIRDASPPTASVFKVITGAALVESGVRASERVCYTGGSQRILQSHLDGHPADATCRTLAEAMGHSSNAVFARLADRHLNGQVLERYAAAFGFGHALPFDLPLPASPAEVPTDRLERARTAAGFWHMHMSPMHAALIASTIAADGVMPRAFLVESVRGETGAEIYHAQERSFRNVIGQSTARVLAQMMERTVTEGTSHSAFYDAQGRPYLSSSVAGKTGSLTGSSPYRAYSWFIGFAPAQNPRYAVAALVVNDPLWRIKASYIAKEALRVALSR